jgi:hypothetical protein
MAIGSYFIRRINDYFFMVISCYFINGYYISDY